MPSQNDNLKSVSASQHASPGARFNGAMLTTAREAKFLSQGELAEMLGVSQPLVARWEADNSSPNQEQVSSLSQKLGVRSELFFVDRPRRLASMSEYYHRALAKASRKDVKAIQARCSILDIQIDRLLQITDNSEDNIPDYDPESPGFDPETIADLARKDMGIGPGPIRNLVGAIESCGGIIIDYDLTIPEVDALCRWVPAMPKLFFINGTKPADRIRWSLAHELGHTIMHFGRDLDQKTAEDQANKFAAAFLMPAKDIRGDFRRPVNLPDLAAIKRKWRISMQAAARRAESIGFIDKQRLQWLFVQMSRNGWRKSEPVPIAGETPTAFTNLLHQAIDKGFTKRDLADWLFVFEDSIDKMLIDAQSPSYQDSGVRLRVVRNEL